MGMFDWLGDAAKAVVHGVEDAAEWVGDRVEDAAEWVGDRVEDVEHWFGDLFDGDVGSQAMSVPEVVEKVMASQGATDWHGSAGTAAELASDHRAVAARIQNISSGLESVWTGSGAEAAQAKLKPLGEVADSAAQTFNANSTHVTGIASGFDEMKRSLTPLPSSPPHKTLWDVATPWDTDTEDQINKYNTQIQQNLDRYNSYAQQAQDAGGQLAIDYGQIGTFDGNISLATDQKAGTHDQPTSHTDSTNSTNSTDSTGNPISRPGIPSSAPTTHTGSPVTAPTPGPGDGAGHSRWPESLGTGGTDSTTTSAYVAPGRAVTGVGTTYGTPGGGGSSAPVDGFAAFGGLGVGAAGGFAGTGDRAGSGGLGRGGAPGEGGQPGAGSRTGAGPRSGPGATAAAEKAAVTGRGGASGLGAAGTGAGRGKGGEDEEHDRKYGIEDDSLFADDGERLVDPETGMHVTPPTIGG